ncbi:MAG: large conductance mechanosensitive channel protein MscL [Acidimicrobiales bacterium]
MLKDFKEFVLRGNVVDLAVGIVIGAAFGAVVSSFVKNLLTPLVSIPGKANFAQLHFTIRSSTFFYGIFLNTLISFLLIAAAVFFFVVRPVNALVARRRKGQENDPDTRQCPECLSDVPCAARRCAFCTSSLEPAA